MVKFGTAGNPELFYDEGGKSSLEMPAWLEKIGLDAYEYQCGRGVKISDEAARKLAKQAEKHNVYLSVHAPYFINISSCSNNINSRNILRTNTTYQILYGRR